MFLKDARRLLGPSGTFEKEVQMYSLVLVEMAEYARNKSRVSLAEPESEILPIPKELFSNNQLTDSVIVFDLIHSIAVFVALVAVAEHFASVLLFTFRGRRPDKRRHYCNGEPAGKWICFHRTRRRRVQQNTCGDDNKANILNFHRKKEN